MNLADLTQLVIVPVILILISVLTFLFAKGIGPALNYVALRMHSEIYVILKARALTYVSALAQDPAWQGLEGAQKKQNAILWMMDYSEKAGVTLTSELASKLIEEAYLSIKNVAIPAAVDALK